MSDRNQTVMHGDVIEFTLHGERRTAEAMLVTDDGVVLLDLFDGDRPGWGRLSLLEDVTVYRPDGTRPWSPPDVGGVDHAGPSVAPDAEEGLDGPAAADTSRRPGERVLDSPPRSPGARPACGVTRF